MEANRLKNPPDWKPDIDRSVAEYDAWYKQRSPEMFADARGRAVIEVEEAMRLTNDFRAFDADALIARPSMLFVARVCVAPPMARDRFVGFAHANKSLVTAMERGGIPARTKNVRAQLEAMADFLRPLLDPSLFVWVEENRDPTDLERDKALLVVGERLATAFYLPELRNAQEARQKELMREYLEDEGFNESAEAPFDMPPGTFGFGRDVEGVRDDGEPQKLPMDCVVSALDENLPLACIELKSAGDFTNVNKRRKEESDKHASLRRAHGEDVVFLLQLFGYFGPTYLSFEAAAGIDWAWDHRLSDLTGYLGIE
jgi:hypothetical protein